MKKPTRFFYVRARTSDLVHKAYGSKVEGNRTLCGLTMRKGWMWTAAAKFEAQHVRCWRCGG